jgi:hypothetical protein
MIRNTLFAAAVGVAVASTAQARDPCRDVPVSQLTRAETKSCDALDALNDLAAKQQPVLTRAEVETEETRKRAVRAASGYRDPVSIDLCPPPHYHMTVRDGCEISPRSRVRVERAAEGERAYGQLFRARIVADTRRLRAGPQ